MRIILAIILLPCIISAQKKEKGKDTEYQCRSVEVYEKKKYREYDEDIEFIGVRVYDNKTGSTLMEYKYPRSLVDRKDIESILAQYVADVTPYARECPVTPSLEERYRDPFAYRIDFIGLEEEGPQEISTELVEIYGGYRITYYETVDTAAGEPYLISYMTARDGDTDKYTRSNATMLIRDLAETRKVWQYYIRDMIDAEPDPDAEPSLEEVLRKRYNIEYSRQSTESKKAKDKERIKAGKCDKYKKKSTITGRGPLIIELCKGEEKDIEIVTDGKVREADGKLVITGQSITIEVLKNTELKITGHVD